MAYMRLHYVVFLCRSLSCLLSSGRCHAVYVFRVFTYSFFNSNFLTSFVATLEKRIGQKAAAFD